MAEDETTTQAFEPARDEASLGHFRVHRRADGSLWELGRGAMGVTYRAFDTSLRIEVALKVIAANQVRESEARHRFQREARAAAKIRHPNVASVLFLGEQGGEFFYAMEFIDGQSLQSLLAHGPGPLPVAVAVALAAQAAAALNAAHKQEVVHRDLKPANLMLLEGDAVDHEDERTAAAGRLQLKVIDFGLARSFGKTRQEESLVTQSLGGFIGTPAYASPEQCRCESDLDGRSDLYSLGVILWQMLSGTLPFSGGVTEVLGRHQFQPPPFERLTQAGVPDALIETLRGLLIKDPAQRVPQTAGELRTILDDHLRACTAGGPSPVKQVLPPPDGDIEKTRDTTATPVVGTTLLTRYRLGEQVGGGDGGRLFLAADNAQADGRVALKLLRPERMAEGVFAAQVETALERARQFPHPVFLAHPDGLQRSGEATFYVREWAEGFSLLELLRARHALGAAEVRALLETLPGALDHAAGAGFPLLELALRKVFVVPRVQGAATGPDASALRSLAVAQWPAFALKVNPLSFPPAQSGSGGASSDVTYLAARPLQNASGTAAALARIIRELLGGQADGHAPLTALDDQGNAILRRALDADATAAPYPTAVAFADAFFATVNGMPGPSTHPGADPAPKVQPDRTTTRLPAAKGVRRLAVLGPPVAVVAAAIIFRLAFNGPTPATPTGPPQTTSESVAAPVSTAPAGPSAAPVLPPAPDALVASSGSPPAADNPAVPGPPTVAVLRFENRSPGDRDLGSFTDGLLSMTTNGLDKTGRYRLVERERIDAVLKELDLTKSGSIDAATAARAGKLLGAQFLVYGGALEAFGKYRVDARMVRVETGAIVATASGMGSADQVFEIADKMVSQLNDGFTKDAPPSSPVGTGSVLPR